MVSRSHEKARFGLVIDFIAAQLGLIRTLRGLTPTFGCFDDEQFDELQIERRFVQQPGSGDRRVLVLDPQAAGALLRRRLCGGRRGRSRRRNGCSGRRRRTSRTAEYHFYGALSRAASCDAAPADERRQHHRRCGRSPPTARSLGRELPGEFREPRRAGRRRDRPHRRPRRSTPSASTNRPSARRATTASSTTRRSPMSSLALLRGARLRARSRDLYLRNARYCYLRWGADGKVRQLEEMYPHLRDGGARARPDEHDRDAGRTPRSRDRDQGVAGRLGRDRAGEADRHAHAHGDRAGGRRARPVDSVEGRAADRGGSHDQRRHGRRAAARRARDRGRAAGSRSSTMSCAPARA